MNKILIEPIPTFTTRLVKSEDLNHHGTLFAGRTAEWFVESGFIAVASIVDPKNVVCLKIHGMHFTKPIYPGQIIQFESKVVFAGRTSFVSYVEVMLSGSETLYVSGFMTFIYVDKSTNSAEHNIEIKPVTEKDKMLYEQAKNIRKS